MNLQEKTEMECFGTTLQDFKDSTFMTDWNDPQSVLMLSMSIQSDCQEMLERGYTPNEIRQYLNLSKYCCGEAGRLMRLKDACVKQFTEVK